jgi:hypothetical protein
MLEPQSKTISYAHLFDKAPSNQFNLLMHGPNMKLYNESDLDGKLKMIRDLLPLHAGRCMISAMIMTTEGARVQMLKSREVNCPKPIHTSSD